MCPERRLRCHRILADAPTATCHPARPPAGGTLTARMEPPAGGAAGEADENGVQANEHRARMGHGRPSGRRSWVEVSFKDPPGERGVHRGAPVTLCSMRMPTNLSDPSSQRRGHRAGAAPLPPRTDAFVVVLACPACSAVWHHRQPTLVDVHPSGACPANRSVQTPQRAVPQAAPAGKAVASHASGRPPPPQGMQTFLTMLGASVLIPSILVPAMGGTTKGKLLVLRSTFNSCGSRFLLAAPLLLTHALPPLSCRRSGKSDQYLLHGVRHLGTRCGFPALLCVAHPAEGHFRLHAAAPASTR